jgi:hypothetical protein
MKKLSLSSTFVLTLGAALALAVGCAVQDASVPDTSDNAAALGGSEAGPTCDDFDTFCGDDRPCGEGFVCAFGDHCGSNFFGTYPNCGVTATCYPICVPGTKG